MLPLAVVLATGCLGCNRHAEVSLHEPDAGATDTDSDSDGDIDGDADSDTDADTDYGTDWVGVPCDPPVEEDEEDPCPLLVLDENAFCFAWQGAPGGFCTKECTAATFEIPVQDGCPSFDGVVCTDISRLTTDPADDEVGYNICVEECLPEPLGQQGPCKADYDACDPRAWAWESQRPTCLFPKCQSDADCLIASGPECVGDGDCSVEDGETCSDDGLCVFEADCDVASGRCTWEAGDPDAEAGDPCESAHDCNANTSCVRPAPDSDGKVAPANGYCIKLGCKALMPEVDPAVTDELGCGMLGVCHNGFAGGGACLKRCNPPNDVDAFRCRQQSWDSEVLDQAGDYECYDSTNLEYYVYTSGNLETIVAAAAPYCVWVSRDIPFRVGPVPKCGTEDGELSPSDCYDYFMSASLLLSMSCRDPETGELDDYGYCLDGTTSGPTESWDTDADTDTT